MNGYDLSRKWFDWAFENPEKISPNHSALYFFAIEHCNRLGWREKFGFPTEMAKDAIGIKSYNTYIKTLNDLVDWGFIKMIERSKNQYSSNIIALSYFDKALDKALDKAITKHLTKQSESTCESNDSINKPKTIKPKTSNIKEDEEDVLFTIDKLKERYLSDEDLVSAVSQTLNTNHGEIEKKLTTFNEHLKSTGINSKKWLDYTSHFLNYERKKKEKSSAKKEKGKAESILEAIREAKRM